MRFFNLFIADPVTIKTVNLSRLFGALAHCWLFDQRVAFLPTHPHLPSGKIGEGAPSPIFPEGRWVSTQATSEELHTDQGRPLVSK